MTYKESHHFTFAGSMDHNAFLDSNQKTKLSQGDLEPLVLTPVCYSRCTVSAYCSPTLCVNNDKSVTVVGAEDQIRSPNCLLKNAMVNI